MTKQANLLKLSSAILMICLLACCCLTTAFASAEPASAALTVVSGGVSPYSIVYSDSEGGFCQEAAENLARAIENAAAAILPVVPAGDDGPACAIRITISAELGVRDYGWHIDGSDIVISGGSEYAAYQAVNRFIQAAVADADELTLPGDLTESFVYEADKTLGSLDEIRASLADVNGRVMIAAHRGAHIDYPDNSLPAIQAAVDMGADIVEIDVHRTADGRLVLCHDDYLSSSTNSADYLGTEGYPDSDQVTDWTLEQLSVLRLTGTDYPIPTLDQVFDIVRGQALVLLDKVVRSDDLSLAEDIYRLAVECEAVDSLMYQHDSRYTMPDSFFDAIYAQTGIPVAHHIYTSSADFMIAFVEGYTPKQAQIQSLQVSFQQNESYLNPDYIRPMAAITRLFANTLDGQLAMQADTPEVWQLLCDAGFSMIQSNNPEPAIAFAQNYERAEELAMAS